jgi:tetratricopeptide (TPR) repeat protein
MEDRLRPLWDISDLDATEERLRSALAAEATDSGRAEVLSQLARLEWARGLDAAESLLAEAEQLADDDEVARARVLLERGRIVRRTHGDAAALPVLERAYDASLAAGQHFMAGDAAHACALAGDMVAWTNRGLELADRYSAAAYWRGTLLVNLGDWQWDRGEHEEALASYEAALEARKKDSRNPYIQEYARYCVARALRELGRPAEAVPLLEQAVSWAAERQFKPSESLLFREELAAAYDDVGRRADADAERAALAALRANASG